MTAQFLRIGIKRVQELSAAGKMPSIDLPAKGSQFSRIYERQALPEWMRTYMHYPVPVPPKQVCENPSYVGFGRVEPERPRHRENLTIEPVRIVRKTFADLLRM